MKKKLTEQLLNLHVYWEQTDWGNVFEHLNNLNLYKEVVSVCLFGCQRITYKTPWPIGELGRTTI